MPVINKYIFQKKFLVLICKSPLNINCNSAATLFASNSKHIQGFPTMPMKIWTWVLQILVSWPYLLCFQHSSRQKYPCPFITFLYISIITPKLLVGDVFDSWQLPLLSISASTIKILICLFISDQRNVILFSWKSYIFLAGLKNLLPITQTSKKTM